MSGGWPVGGAAEADAAYEEAFDAIFNLAVESYRHPIPQISKKNGRQKWSMIEMWPMTVSASVAGVHLLHPFHFAWAAETHTSTKLSWLLLCVLDLNLACVW